MSSHTLETVSVPVFIGASGNPSTVPESEPYMKDYIVKQNLILQQDNKNLAEEHRQIKSELDDLEEQHDNLEKHYTKTKLYIKDFYHLNKYYKELYTRDREWMKTVKSQKDTENLIRSSSSLTKYFNTRTYLTCIYVLLTTISCLMLPPMLALISLLVFHFTFTFTYLNTNPILEAKMQTIDGQILTLLALHKDKDAEIGELTKTMDIISEFVDNAL